MCERPKPSQHPPEPPSVSDEQVKALIAISRRAAEATGAEILSDVRATLLIDDRDERRATAAAIMVRLVEAQRRAN
jgi:hypothetical protein